MGQEQWLSLAALLGAGFGVVPIGTGTNGENYAIIPLMHDKDFVKKLMRLALPICFQTFMLAAVAAGDAFMLGSVDQNSMAAVSLATQIQFIQNMILIAGVTSTTILGAQYWGKKDLRTMDDLFSLSLRVCGIISVIFFVACVFFPEYLMRLYTDEDALISIGITYLQVAGFSYLITGFSQSYQAMMKVTDHVSTVAVVSSSAVVLNIVVNAVFIFGLGMGARGAALATLIARIVEFAVVIILSYRPGFIHPRLSAIFRSNRLLALDFIKCAWPLLGGGLLWGIGFTAYTSFMGHLGTDAAAANSVTAVVRDLVCCACDGLAAGCGILIGNELGAGRLEVGKYYGIRMVKIAFIVGFACTGIMLALTPVLLNSVKLTAEARDFLWQMMIVMAVYMIGRTVNTIIINGVFASGGDTLFDMYSLAIVMWCIAIPLAALGTYYFHWPVVIIYACTCLDEVGKIPWTMLHFRKYKWVKDLTRERTD